jgi:hypothetical protein
MLGFGVLSHVLIKWNNNFSLISCKIQVLTTRRAGNVKSM